MKYTVEQCKLLSKKRLTEKIFDFTVYATEIAPIAKCGQFANILAEGKFLRRPISICKIDKEQNTLRFVFEVRGEGTKIISEKNEGDMLDIFAPLGNGFTLFEKDKKAVIIGGGIGVPPMLEVASYYGEGSDTFLGFRSKENVILEDDFVKTGTNLKIATDDGSYGYNGYVTGVLEERLKNGQADVIYACGPMPMLKLISQIAEKYNVDCQVSLEERMGCGMGACLVCACKIKAKTETGYTYKHVCKYGPVFDSREVEWNG